MFLNKINPKINIQNQNKKGSTLTDCYPSGGGNHDTLTDGLTQSQVVSINTSSTYLTSNNNYLFQLSTGMTIEKCNNICLQFNFLYAGLIGGWIEFLKKNIKHPIFYSI